MSILDILCSNPFNLKDKITEIEIKKIFCGPSKILKNVSWHINTCLKYCMTPKKLSGSPFYIFNVRSLGITYKLSSLQRLVLSKKSNVKYFDSLCNVVASINSTNYKKISNRWHSFILKSCIDLVSCNLVSPSNC